VTAYLRDRPAYPRALEALRLLKDELGPRDEVRAIAAFLIEAAEAEVGAGGFPYVGDPNDPRDRAVVEAHQDYWRRFMDGEDLEENWREL
jgi:hypothetical protein